MEILISKLTPEEWAPLSELAHKFAFKEERPASEDRISFALLLKNEKGELLAYVTALETHSDTVYLQYGGTFPGALQTSLSWKCYALGIEWCKARYKRIITFISNKNKVMLKFAMKVGFEIVGIKLFKGFVLVDHALEVNDRLPRGLVI